MNFFQIIFKKNFCFALSHRINGWKDIFFPEVTMNIYTTYVMRDEVIALLEEAEEKTKLPKEELLVQAMRKMMKDYETYERTDGRIEYQKRFDEDTGEHIKKQRVKLKVNLCDYNYYQDMRRIFRRSISLVMAIAVYTYLAEIVEKILNKEIEALLADTYPFQNYAIMGKCIENIPTWRIWWGVPSKLKLLLTK